MNSEREEPVTREEPTARHETHRRSVLKGVTWRIVGTIDTFILSYLISGSAKVATGIGTAEFFTKIGLYYLHERVWNAVPPRASRRFLKGMQEDHTPRESARKNP